MKQHAYAINNSANTPRQAQMSSLTGRRGALHLCHSLAVTHRIHQYDTHSPITRLSGNSGVQVTQGGNHIASRK